MAEQQWETLYRWEWFHREQWRPHFRERKAGKRGGSCGALKKLLGDDPPTLALDSSCGLGLKTIVLKEMGVNIVGSDGCAFAVEKARELARLEGCEIEYFTSRWPDLPKRTGLRFGAIFNDALSWIVTRDEFDASLEGVLGALKPGGILVFSGAPQGGPSGPEWTRKLLEELWQQRARFSIEWTFEQAGTRCTSILAREKGDTFVDDHHIFLIEEDGRQRIESATIRQPVYWHWPLLAEMFAKAGFSKLETRTFRGMARGGAALDLNIATAPP